LAASNNPTFNVNTLQTPPEYIECIRKWAPREDTAYQLSLACINILQEYAASLGLSPYNRAVLVYGLDDRMKPTREQLVAEAKPMRDADRQAEEDKRKASIEADVRTWGACAVKAASDKDSAGVPLLDAVRIVKLTCGYLWKGAPGDDDGLYYRIIKAVREGQQPAADAVVTSVTRSKPADIRM
jgi:hypothetical protein